MKYLLRILFVIFVCSNIFVARADTITMTWLNEDGTTTYDTTTCNAGDDVILPTAPTKRGYTFQGWATYYTPIEYLESTGTQYIDTGFKPNQASGFILDYYANRTERPRIAMISENISDTPYGYGVVESSSESNANISIYTGKRSEISYYWKISQLSGTGRYVVNINKNVGSITDANGNIYTHIFPTDTFQFANNLHLFTIINNGTIIANDGTVRIYSAKILDNDVLVRDFIPVLDANGVACMYDKVEDKIYHNAGTGDFIAGPIISE